MQNYSTVVVAYYDYNNYIIIELNYNVSVLCVCDVLVISGESSDGVSNIDDEVESIYIESLQAGPVSILLECLVLCAMIDKSRSKGLAEVASNIDFLKLQMDHYHHRKGIVESISK